jgi:hypothetical protein
MNFFLSAIFSTLGLVREDPPVFSDFDPMKSSGVEREKPGKVHNRL